MTTTTIQFTPEKAWGYAAQWGSAMSSGDSGACMYGFYKDCRPQSEEHRQAVIDWMNKCLLDVVANPDDYDDDELQKIDAFIEFIKNRGLKEDSFILELSSECVSACRLDGGELDGDIRQDLLDCNRSGDMTEPCKYVLSRWKPQFCVVKMVDGEYKNVEATYEDKLIVCMEIYSSSGFNRGTPEDLLERYIVWQAASDLSAYED